MNFILNWWERHIINYSKWFLKSLCLPNSCIQMTIWSVLGSNCPDHSFLCANNECVPYSKICNGISDCQDNSDETKVCTGNN